jgi:hypothetical protein
MTAATWTKPDGRSRDLITLPRAGVEEAWMDVQASALETREILGDAHRDLLERRDPRPHLFDAHDRLTWLADMAHRKAGEAAGITFISPGQMPLPDGCFDSDDRSA